MVSAFGARFDMETDALLILALSVLVWRHAKAGAWVLASGLLRARLRRRRAGVAVAARASAVVARRGRVICIVQIAGVGRRPLAPRPWPAERSALLGRHSRRSVTHSRWMWPGCGGRSDR